MTHYLNAKDILLALACAILFSSSTLTLALY